MRDGCFEVTGRNDKFIFCALIYNFDEISCFDKYFIDNLLFLEKYKDVCFTINHNDDIIFKAYFINKNSNYEVIFVSINQKDKKIYNKDWKLIFDTNVLINYCKNISSIKINNIMYKTFPFNWEDILTSDKKDKDKDKKKN